MATSYRAIFAAPGAKRFSAAGLLGRMPTAMLSIGIVTMVSQLTGEYGLAGAVAAAFVLSVALVSPQVSRLVDRYGQRRVLRPATLGTVTAVMGLTMSTHLGWPQWTLFAFAACAGCAPGLGAMIRSRWAEIFPDSPHKLHAAYSWESIVDEMCFIIGPIISISLSTMWFPQAGPLAATVLLAAGVWWLTAQVATEPVPQPKESRTPGSALRTPGLPVLVVVMVGLGAIFGSVDVVTVAFAEEQGSKTAASLLIAVYALGSCMAAAGFGLLNTRGPAVRRWLLGVGAMAISMIPLQLVGGLPALALALFLAGFTIAPTMISTVTLIQRLVPRDKLTEGMTWNTAGIAVGISLGSAVSGHVIDSASAATAYAVPLVAGALAVAVGAVGYRRLTLVLGQREKVTGQQRLAPREQPHSQPLA